MCVFETQSFMWIRDLSKPVMNAVTTEYTKGGVAKPAQTYDSYQKKGGRERP